MEEKRQSSTSVRSGNERRDDVRNWDTLMGRDGNPAGATSESVRGGLLVTDACNHGSADAVDT